MNLSTVSTDFGGQANQGDQLELCLEHAPWKVKQSWVPCESNRRSIAISSTRQNSLDDR